MDTITPVSYTHLYYRIRRSFDGVPRETQISCMNFFDQYGYWGKLDVAGGVYEQIEQKAKALFEHMEDFAWLYDRLADYRSKLTLYAVLNNWYCYDFTTTAQAREYAFDDYFDLDLVRCSSGEVMVDLGAYVGDTVLSYILNYGEDCYKKIYCYEITPETFETLRKNLEGCRDIELRQKGEMCIRDRLYGRGGFALRRRCGLQRHFPNTAGAHFRWSFAIHAASSPVGSRHVR